MSKTTDTTKTLDNQQRESKSEVMKTFGGWIKNISFYQESFCSKKI